MDTPTLAGYAYASERAILSRQAYLHMYRLFQLLDPLPTELCADNVQLYIVHHLELHSFHVQVRINYVCFHHRQIKLMFAAGTR